MCEDCGSTPLTDAAEKAGFSRRRLLGAAGACWCRRRRGRLRRPGGRDGLLRRRAGTSPGPAAGTRPARHLQRPTG